MRPYIEGVSKTPSLSLTLLETACWILGVGLLAVYLGATAWGQYGREHGVATFLEARQVVAARRSAPEAIPAAMPPAATAVVAGLSNDAAVLAVLRIPGVGLEVPVGYGTAEPVLLRGAGLIAGTAAPGSRGNVAIAAHRDTFFRALQDVAIGDLIELDAPDRTWTYRITELSVVEPTDVHVLADTGEPVLTLVTCYPFYFVGNAPQRFVVRAVANELST